MDPMFLPKLHQLDQTLRLHWKERPMCELPTLSAYLVYFTMPHPSLNRLTGSAESSVTLRLLEHVLISPEDGDSIVLVVGHPGANQLGRYFAEAASKSLLLSTPDLKDCISINAFDENVVMEDGDSILMDLATFIE
jgi:hypothetical protein